MKGGESGMEQAELLKLRLRQRQEPRVHRHAVRPEVRYQVRFRKEHQRLHAARPRFFRRGQSALVLLRRKRRGKEEASAAAIPNSDACDGLLLLRQLRQHHRQPPPGLSGVYRKHGGQRLSVHPHGNRVHLRRQLHRFHQGRAWKHRYAGGERQRRHPDQRDGSQRPDGELQLRRLQTRDGSTDGRGRKDLQERLHL